VDQTITKLVQDREQGKLSRRELMKGFALAATAASAAGLTPSIAAAEPRIKGIGINHVALDVYRYDVLKLRDFYTDLLGMAVNQGINEKNHTTTVCRIDCGGQQFYLRNGDHKTLKYPRLMPAIDHIAMNVEPWENKDDQLTIHGAPTVEAVLKSHQIELFTDTRDVMFKDPFGFNIQLVGKYRDPVDEYRRIDANPGAGTKLRAVGINHVALDVNEYDLPTLHSFYTEMLGMPVAQGTNDSTHSTTVCRIQSGDQFVYIRNAAHEPPKYPRLTPAVDHIAIAVEPWDSAEDQLTIHGAPTVAAELKRRGIELFSNTRDIMFKDPFGFNIQLVGKNYNPAGEYKVFEGK
jgi:catechol 2,3-dioxygenase-like lactoylglutathione lyase family enzyme